MADNIISGNFTLRQVRPKFTLGTNSYTFQSVNEVKFSFKPSATTKDSYGRTLVLGYEIKSEFNCMSNSNVSLNTLFSILAAQNNSVAGKLEHIDKNANTLVIDSVILTIDGDLSGDGKEGKIKVSCDKIITSDQLMYILFENNL